MQGLTMDFPLTITHMLRRSQQLYSAKKISSRMPDGIMRYTYGDLYERVCKLIGVLQDLGVRPGDRVATFAWNNYRHLELYFAVPCMGAVLHTLNIRLFPEQLQYIVRHAEDKLVFVDDCLLGEFEKTKRELPELKNVIVMGGEADASSGYLDYETLLANAKPVYDFPELDEKSAAGLCYTSGTTGEPKGVLFSHRAIVLNALMTGLSGVLGISEKDVVLPVVPMFHANAWGFPYSSTLFGASQVYCGPFMQPDQILELIQSERVTLSAAVPTIWLGIDGILQENKFDISSLAVIASGGAPLPPSLIQRYDKHGVRIVHSWGMTELSPVGTMSIPLSYMNDWSPEDQIKIRATQGTPIPYCELRTVDEAGNETPRDGKSMGELQVRGVSVVSGYYKDARSASCFQDGWFRTGDVATLSPEGYMQIMDRTKDLVKSGGEWISSVELENAIMAHPDVKEAAVIAVPHERWQERPLACVVLRTSVDESAVRESIMAHLASRVAKWWLPDHIVFLDSIPRTSVGKFDKKVLRQRCTTGEMTLH